MGAGLLSLASSRPELFYKQLIWIFIGLVFVVVFTFLDLRSFFSHGNVSVVLYVITVALLIVTFVFAPSINGNRAWLLIGPFQFQPSELAKLALIIMLATFFAKRHVGIARWKVIIGSFAYAAIPALIIASQPDMGSALIVLGIWFGFLLVSGIPIKRLIIAGVFFVLAFMLLWTSVFKDYQKDRVIGLFQPQQDPLGANYNVIQSKIAIGSGGILGKGFGQGTQTQLGFLPEAQTDFIFAAIAEEGGLLGVGLILCAFLWMMWRLLHVSIMVEGNTAKFLCLGAFVLFLIQFILNVGSVIGILPVVGVTFPFVSYGGSSILVNLILIGLIQSFYVKK
jgi:rod shape determining protein RodA